MHYRVCTIDIDALGVFHVPHCWRLHSVLEVNRAENYVKVILEEPQ